MHVAAGNEQNASCQAFGWLCQWNTWTSCEGKESALGKSARCKYKLAKQCPRMNNVCIYIYIYIYFYALLCICVCVCICVPIKHILWGSLAPGKFHETARVLDPKQNLPSLSDTPGSLVGSHAAFHRSLWSEGRRSMSAGHGHRIASWTHDHHHSPIAQKSPSCRQCLWRQTQICSATLFGSGQCLVSMAAGLSMSHHPCRASCPAEDSKLPIHRHLTAVFGFSNQKVPKNASTDQLIPRKQEFPMDCAVWKVSFLADFSQTRASHHKKGLIGLHALRSHPKVTNRPPDAPPDDPAGPADGPEVPEEAARCLDRGAKPGIFS